MIATALINWGQLVSRIISNTLSAIASIVLVGVIFKAFEKKIGCWWDNWHKARRDARKEK